MTDGSSAAEATVDNLVDQYVQRTFAPSDEVLTGLLDDARRRDYPLIAIHPHEAKIVQVLLRAIRARKVVDVGTCFGYGAIWLARALPRGGKVFTIERNAEFQALARTYVEKAGLSDRVDFRLGEARDVFQDLRREAPVDAVFIDADWEEYPAYLEWALSVLRPGGLVIAHNAHAFGLVILDPDSPDFVREFKDLSEEVYASFERRDEAGRSEFLRALRAIRQFNRSLATDPRLTSVLVPTTEGIAVALVNFEDSSHG
jgi:predicted O-methyltransferase YrrM